jgi:hypothetical protein
LSRSLSAERLSPLLALPIEYVPATHGGPTGRVAFERAIFLTPTDSVTTELSLSPTTLERLARGSRTASSSNDPTNQEAISKPRDQGGHKTGRHDGQLELPVGFGCLRGGCMDGLRHAGWAGR